MIKCTLTVTFLVMLCVSSNAQILTENFDNDSKISKSHTFFNDTTGDYFGIYDPEGSTDDYDGGTNSEAGFPSFTGNTGNFLLGEDLDGGGDGSDVISLTWSNLDITDKNNLTLAIDLAAAPLVWDPGDKILIETQIDGGGYTTLVEFLHDQLNGPTASNNHLADGIVGVGERTVLTNTFQTITKSIAGTGTTLDIKITFRANAGNEEFGVDNLIVSGNDTLSTELLMRAKSNITMENGKFVSADSSLSIEVYNALGQSVNNESLTTGMYILKVTSAKGETITLKKGV
ncbi:T9SS type A sorting domain-containing protein [Wenyingzhuangia sp. IMCC45574]